MARAYVLGSLWLVMTLLATVLLPGDAQLPVYPTHPGLSEKFYDKSCPLAKITIWNSLVRQLALNKALPAQLIRLFFHDCFVRGCDSSIMIASTPGNLAELEARANKDSIKGLDEIAQAKLAVEEICPGVVSCADIIALAARNILQMTSGIYFPVQLGRRDGVVSSAAEADANIPSPFLNYTQLVQSFAKQGLSEKDLVVLSGAHTIGVTHCNLIWIRIYAFSPTVPTDPALDPAFVADLKKQCPFDQPQSRKEVQMDPTLGGNFFDSNYYDNVLAGKTAFISDSALIKNSLAEALVRDLGKFPTFPFFDEFGVSMVKMGQNNVLTGSDGVIRKVCSKV